MEIYVEDPSKGPNEWRKVGPSFSYPLRGKVTLLEKLASLSKKYHGLHYLLFSPVEEALKRADIHLVTSHDVPSDPDEAMHYLQSFVCKHPRRPSTLKIKAVLIKIAGKKRLGIAFNTPTK